MTLQSTSSKRTGDTNLYVLQADAFLHGRLPIDRRLHDTVVYQRRYHCIYPPFPAMLVLPVVAALGVEATNPFAIKLLLTLLNIWTLRSLFLRLQLPKSHSNWLTAATLFGTGYWACLISVGVWYFAQVVAVTFLILAVHEALGKRRPLLVGIFLAAACLSRQLAIYSFVFLAVMLLDDLGPKQWLRGVTRIAALVVPLGVAVAVYLCINAARFGDPLEPGYRYLLVSDPWNSNIERWGLFNAAYIPYNALYMFVQGFHFDLTTDALQLDIHGTSLTFASPFLFFAFAARWTRLRLAAAWLSILLCLMPHTQLLWNRPDATQLPTLRPGLPSRGGRASSIGHSTRPWCLVEGSDRVLSRAQLPWLARPTAEDGPC